MYENYDNASCFDLGTVAALAGQPRQYPHNLCVIKSVYWILGWERGSAMRNYSAGNEEGAPATSTDGLSSTVS